MKRNINYKGIPFYIGNYTPRNNEYEKGQHYKLFVDDMPTQYTFSTIREARTFIYKNYFIWL